MNNLRRIRNMMDMMMCMRSGMYMLCCADKSGSPCFISR